MTINVCKKLNFLLKAKQRNLIRELKDLVLDESTEGALKYAQLKRQWAVLLHRECRAAALRARVQDITEGESYSSYFLGLEKKKQTEQAITQILNTNGDLVTDPAGIEQVIYSFYSSLYRAGNINVFEAESMLNVIKDRISESDRVILNMPIMGQEIEEAKEGLNRGKSPGEDGVIGELYISLKSEVSKLLEGFFNVMWQSGEIPGDFANGIIMPFYKNKGKEVGNYRPISLLNSDYKIMFKIMVNRCKGIMEGLLKAGRTMVCLTGILLI